MLNAAFFFTIASKGMTWGYALVTFAQAFAFWMMSRNALFPRPLFLASIVAIALNLTATVSALEFWWSAFALNRLFDLMLLYIAGCALYRILRLRFKQKGAPIARPQSSDLFAIAWSFGRLTGNTRSSTLFVVAPGSEKPVSPLFSPAL